MTVLPGIEGIIRRRMLVNFRVEEAVAQALLPRPFRPKLHKGAAVAGICVIRLEKIRPAGFPGLVGFSSENAAHRIAVEWDEGDGPHEAVYIPRRDTGSLLNRVAGGRLFPGEHGAADFRVTDDGDRIELQMRSRDGTVAVDVSGRNAVGLPSGSGFDSLEEASRFFERGSVGYSDTSAGDHLDAIVLETDAWRVMPLGVDRVHSSFFADERRFPPGSVTFDCALVMRDITHRWRVVPRRSLTS